MKFSPEEKERIDSLSKAFLEEILKEIGQERFEDYSCLYEVLKCLFATRVEIISDLKAKQQIQQNLERRFT